MKRDKSEGRKEIKTEGHLTSIVTSNQENIEKNGLSEKVDTIRRKIVELELSDMEKMAELLSQFKNALDENCNRIKGVYETYGCADILIEPAIGYFIPDVDKKDALLHGAEPSVIVTALDLSKDGLDKFLLASGIVGQKYEQQAEILKFPISKEKFKTYVEKKLSGDSDLIGTVTDDQIIPTFEIVVHLDELFKSNSDVSLSDNYFKNIPFYVNLITELARKKYAASTWPTNRKEFSTIYIRGWESASRKFRTWYDNFRSIIGRYSKRDFKEIPGGTRLGRETSPSGTNMGLSGFRLVGELLLIPQSEPNILSGDSLLYAELTGDKKRESLVQKLLEIL